MPWDNQYDLNQGGSPSPAGQPMNIDPNAQAADPNAGAGWRQNVKNVASAIGDAAAGMQVTNGQLQSRGSQPQAPAPTQGIPQMPGAPGNPQQQQMLQRAQMLLKQGTISQAQFDQMFGQQPGMPPTIAPPTGPTSQAWVQ